jgi:hypothetical protein
MAGATPDLRRLADHLLVDILPDIQLAIGGVALILRNLLATTGAFERAVEMDPQLVDTWMILARIKAAIGDREGANKTRKPAVSRNLTDPSLQQPFAECDRR